MDNFPRGLKRRMEERERGNEDLTWRMGKLKRENEGLKQRVEKLQGGNDLLSVQIADLQKDREKWIEAYENLTEAYERVTRAYGKIAEAYEMLTEAFEIKSDLESELERAKSRAELREHLIAQQIGEIEELQLECAILIDERNTLKQSVDAKCAAINVLKTDFRHERLMLQGQHQDKQTELERLHHLKQSELENSHGRELSDLLQQHHDRQLELENRHRCEIKRLREESEEALRREEAQRLELALQSASRSEELVQQRRCLEDCLRRERGYFKRAIETLTNENVQLCNDYDRQCGDLEQLRTELMRDYQVFQDGRKPIWIIVLSCLNRKLVSTNQIQAESNRSRGLHATLKEKREEALAECDGRVRTRVGPDLAGRGEIVECVIDLLVRSGCLTVNLAQLQSLSLDKEAQSCPSPRIAIFSKAVDFRLDNLLQKAVATYATHASDPNRYDQSEDPYSTILEMGNGLLGLDSPSYAMQAQQIRHQLPSGSTIDELVTSRICTRCNSPRFSRRQLSPETFLGASNGIPGLYGFFVKRVDEYFEREVFDCCRSTNCMQCIMDFFTGEIERGHYNLRRNWEDENCQSQMECLCGERHDHESWVIMFRSSWDKVSHPGWRLVVQKWIMSLALRKGLLELEPRPSGWAVSESYAQQVTLQQERKAFSYFDPVKLRDIDIRDIEDLSAVAGEVKLLEFNRNGASDIELAPFFMKFLPREAKPRSCSSCWEGFYEVEWDSAEDWIDNDGGLGGSWKWKIFYFPTTFEQLCQDHPLETCRKCMETYIATRLEEPNGCNSISCPECSRMFTPAEIKFLASSETAQRYDYLQFRSSAASVPDFRWCLRPGDVCDSGQIHVGGADLPIVTCAACGFETCFLHQIPYHHRLNCEEFDSQRTNGDPSYQATKQYLDKYSKVCPGPDCNVGVLKIGGCFHMRCEVCKFEYCWECNAAYEGPEGDKTLSRDDHNLGCYFRTHDVSPMFISGRDLEEALRD